MNQDLKAPVRRKLGDTPTADQVIDYLSQGGAVTFKSARIHVVREEFFRLMRVGDRTAFAIEEELGDRFGLSAERVRQIRLKREPRKV